MPLLIYGADVNIDKDITIEGLVEKIDDTSWEEFMPKGVDKSCFKDFIKYYDPDIFVAAGKRIRNIVKAADVLEPTERIQKITKLFSCFKNPDKETVLTPWRVVNLHISDCLGGYDFYDEKHENEIDAPRYVDQGKVTEDTLGNCDAKILEINSKSGLYPLYATYSIYRAKCKRYDAKELTSEIKNKLWEETVKNNIFVICKTKMAKYITKRTLVGFKDVPINAHYFDDLLSTIKNKPKLFIMKVKNSNYWKTNEGGTMKFDAVIGNSQYQLQGGSGGNNDAPIYQHFAEVSVKVSSTYVSLINTIKMVWVGRENLLGTFKSYMINNKNLKKLVAFSNSRDIFPNVEIKGGICYYLIDFNYLGDCNYLLVQEGRRGTSVRKLNNFGVLIREVELASIVKKVLGIHANASTIDTIISNDTPLGIGSNPKFSKKNL